MPPPVDQHTQVVEERICHLVELILTSKFKSGRTVRELADRWGIGENRIYQYMMEANARVRSQIAARTARTIEKTLRTVAMKGRAGAMPGDLSAAVQASVALAKIAAWDQPPKEESVPEQSAPRTITVTYHQSVKPDEEESDGAD